MHTCAGHQAHQVLYRVQSTPAQGTVHTCTGYSTHLQCTVHTCTGHRAHLHRVPCTPAQGTVHTCAGYNAHLQMVKCTPAQGTVHTCTGYSAHLHRVQCTPAQGTVHTCTGYNAHLYSVQCTPVQGTVHTCTCTGVQCPEFFNCPLAVGECTLENGSLEISADCHYESSDGYLDQTYKDHTPHIREELANEITFEPIPLKPGDVLAL